MAFIDQLLAHSRALQSNIDQGFAGAINKRKELKRLQEAANLRKIARADAALTQARNDESALRKALTLDEINQAGRSDDAVLLAQQVQSLEGQKDELLATARLNQETMLEQSILAAANDPLIDEDERKDFNKELNKEGSTATPGSLLSKYPAISNRAKELFSEMQASDKNSAALMKAAANINTEINTIIRTNPMVMSHLEGAAGVEATTAEAITPEEAFRKAMEAAVKAASEGQPKEAPSAGIPKLAVNPDTGALELGSGDIGLIDVAREIEPPQIPGVNTSPLTFLNRSADTIAKTAVRPVQTAEALLTGRSTTPDNILAQLGERAGGIVADPLLNILDAIRSRVQGGDIIPGTIPTTEPLDNTPIGFQ